MPSKRLTDRLGEELSRREKEAQVSHAARCHLARLWDNAVEASPLAQRCIVPTYVHAGTYASYGSAGTLAFKDASPEQCYALIQAFPPVELVLHRDASHCIGVRPATAVEETAKSVESVPGGVVLTMDRVSHYPAKIEAAWYVSLEGAHVRFSVELRAVWGITPTYQARVTYDRYGNGEVVAVADAKPGFPVDPGTSLKHIRYSAHSPAAFPHLLVYGYVREYVARLAAVCYERGVASQRAYEEARERLQKAALHLDPAEGDLDQRYDADSLRPGTREQYKCLNSAQAVADKELAEKHWKEYAADHGIEIRQEYFDHYAWACAWLKRKGLYEVPHPNDSGKRYKYGHEWL